MRLEGSAVRLTVYVGERDLWFRRPLYSEIVRRAHDAGLAGATALRCLEGYGASSQIHTSKMFSLAEDLPVEIVIVDIEEKIRAFVTQLDELVTNGIVIIDNVEVIRYVGKNDDE